MEEAVYRFLASQRGAEELIVCYEKGVIVTTQNEWEWLEGAQRHNQTSDGQVLDLWDVYGPIGTMAPR